jgi:hypothetical protein
MIVTLKLVLSIENDPANLADPVALKEAVCRQLKGLKIAGHHIKTEIKDAGVYGSGLSSEWDK